MRAEEPDSQQGQQPQEDRDSIWSIPLGRRALYFGLFSAYALAGIGFLVWYEVFEHTADTWPQTILSITQGIGVTTVGAAGLALLTIEAPRTLMVIGDYLKKRLIEPLEERRRLEAEQRKEEALAMGREQGRAEGEARRQAEWVAWNERRLAYEARGEPFDEPPPELPAAREQDDGEPPPGTSSTESE